MITNAYSGRVTNWTLFWIANVLAVALVVMSGLSHPFVLGLVVVAAVVLLANLMVTSIRTTVGPAGVVVRYGLLGLPRFRYALTSIESAEVVDVPFSQMGGWGIHWSPWRGTRLTIRSGPALVLHRTGGNKVTISCADPQTAVDVINSTRSVAG